MGRAICFKCGFDKSGSLSECNCCHATPQSGSELATSIVLSEHMSTAEQLSQYAAQIRGGNKPAISGSALTRAVAALKDPQLMAFLGERPRPANAPAATSSASSPPLPRAPAQSAMQVLPAPMRPVEPVLKKPVLTTSALHQSPFALLGATTRDDRRKIKSLSDEKSLELDDDVCQKAYSDLTNPRTRLSVELAWLPGVSPRKSNQMLETLLNHPMALRDESSLPTLAHLNLLAAALEAVDGKHDVDDFVSFIHEIADLTEQLDMDEVLRDINEDRTVSGFPEIPSTDQIEAELAERKRYYRNAVKDAFNSLPATNLVQAMTEVVDQATANGEDHAPELIDELVDLYEQETQGVLEKAASNVQSLIESTKKAVDSGEQAVKPFIDKIHATARDWDRIAQPIQLSCKARGIDHGPSFKLAHSIRNLALFLFNEHDMLVQSQRLTALLQELFAEVPEFAEQVEQDSDALADIFQNRKQAEAKREANKRAWEQEISYRVDLGLIFKDTLSISPEGVSFKKQHYPLDSVTRVYWGATRHSTNGVYTGTTYSIAFGDNGSIATVETNKEEIFSNFIDRLWKAVCVRIMGETLVTLQEGGAIPVADAWMHDTGMTFKKKKFLGAAENAPRAWAQVQTWNSNGSFCIGAADDKKLYVALPYIHSANAHIYQQILGMAFKKPGLKKLSELLG